MQSLIPTSRQALKNKLRNVPDACKRKEHFRAGYLIKLLEHLKIMICTLGNVAVHENLSTDL